MPLASVSINKNATGIGRVQASNDGISGIVFFETAPGSFSSNGIEQVFSLAQAEDKGLTSSAFPVPHYHVSEFFRLNPNGELWIGFTGSTTVDFTFATTLQNAASSTIRQIGFFTSDLLDAAMVSSAQSAADTLVSDKHPASFLLTADVYDDGGTTYQSGITDLPDLSGNGHSHVSVFIGQSAEGTADSLFTSNNYTIGTVGAALGATSIARVHQSIAWPALIDLTGDGFGKIGIGTQDDFETLTRTQKESVHDKGFNICIRYPGTEGIHFSGSQTLADTTDFYSIERTRAIDKVLRIADGVLAPKLNSPLYLEDDGTLNAATIRSFIEDLDLGTQSMEGTEVSAIEYDMDPAQDVLTTDKVVISAKIIPVGRSSTIELNLTYVANL